MKLTKSVARMACSLSAVVLSAAAASAQCDGLVGHWRLDGDALDSSGLGNHGIPFGSPVYVPGVAGQAMALDGLDDFVQIANHPSLNPTNAISLCAWYRPVSFSGSGSDPIIDKGYFGHSPPYYQYQLNVTGDRYGTSPGTLGVYCAIGNGAAGASTGGGFWTAGQWHGVVATYDGAFLKFFANGVLMQSNPATGPLTDFGRPVLLGRFNNLGFHLPGTIDEVRIFGRALSDDEAVLVSSSPTADPLVLPRAVRACGGATVTLRAVHLAAAGSTYQWRKDGQVLENETGQSLMLATVTVLQTGSYDCLVTGPCGAGVAAANTVVICAADFNCDGSLDPDDLADYIGAFFADTPLATSDFNADGLIDPDDLADFIGAFFAGC